MTILCYHAVDPAWSASLSVSPENFHSHLQWLRRRRRIVDLRAALGTVGTRYALPRRAVALTFDDGFRSVYEHVFPILRSTGVPATIFVVANTLLPSPQIADWVDDPTDAPPRTMSAAEVREMHEAGLLIGSHSASHRDLTQLSYEECLEDLLRSRHIIQDAVGAPVDLLAYPRGRHDDHVRRAARRAGFAYAFGLPEGPEPLGPHAIPRVGVYRGNSRRALALKCSPWFFRARMSSAYRLGRRAYRMVSRARGR
jgi:peptidoglycan/xylan/chitin deacetylase (PgdA/CDA1 family)